MRCLLAALVIAVASGVARGDSQADAVALFDQGIKDLQAGDTAKVCKELSASLAKYADSGTKGALARCYTQLGHLAKAWQLWRDLAETAPAADLRADAAANAAKLDGRLARVVVKVPVGFLSTWPEFVGTAADSLRSDQVPATDSPFHALLSCVRSHGVTP